MEKLIILTLCHFGILSTGSIVRSEALDVKVVSKQRAKRITSLSRAALDSVFQ